MTKNTIQLKEKIKNGRCIKVAPIFFDLIPQMRHFFEKFGELAVRWRLRTYNDVVANCLDVFHAASDLTGTGFFGSGIRFEHDESSECAWSATRSDGSTRPRPAPP